MIRVSPARDSLLLAFLVVVVVVGLSLWVHLVNGDSAIILDEVAFLWQARLITQGHLTAPAPAHPEFVNIDFLPIRSGLRFSKYPVGYPLALAPWLLVGIPWALNVFLAGLSLVLMYAFALRVGGRSLAWAATGLLAISPYFVGQSTIYQTHPLLLVLTQVILLSLLNRERAPDRLRWMVFSGAAMGYMLNITPFAAASVALVIATRLLRVRRVAPLRRREIVAFAVPVLFGLLAFLFANWRTTGSPFVPGYYLDPKERIGFGAGIGPDGYGPAQAWDHTRRRLHLLGKILFGWPVSSFLFAVPYLLVFGADRLRAIIPGRFGSSTEGHRREAGRGAWTTELLVLFFGNLTVYAFWYYHGNGPTWGPRYLYHTIAAPIVFTGRGILGLGKFLGAVVGRRPRMAFAGRLVPFLLVGALTVEGTIPYYRWLENHHLLRIRRADRSFIEDLKRSGITRGTIFVDPRSVEAFTGLPGLLYQTGLQETGPLVLARNYGQKRNAALVESRGEGPVYYAWFEQQEFRWHIGDRLPGMMLD